MLNQDQPDTQVLFGRWSRLLAGLVDSLGLAEIFIESPTGETVLRFGKGGNAEALRFDLRGLGQILVRPRDGQLLGPHIDTLSATAALIAEDAVLVKGSAGSALQRSEAARDFATTRLHLLTETTLDDYFIHDEEGRFLDVNDRACASLGYTREEFLSMRVFDISRQKPQQEQFDIWRTAPHGTVVKVLVDHTRKDGSRFPCEVMISCHQIGERRYFLGLVRDMTESVTSRRRLEALNAELEARVAARTTELSEAKARFEAILDTVEDAIALRDTDGSFLQVNRAFSRIFGVTPDAVVGKKLEDFLPPDAARADADANRQVVVLGETITTSERLPQHLGGGMVLTTRTPRRTPGGQITGLVSVSRDISAQQAVEEALKLERERLTLATQVGKLGIMDYHLESGELIPNPELLSMFGHEGRRVTIESLNDCIHPEDRDRVLIEFERVLRGEPREEVSLRVFRRGAELRWLSAAARLVGGDEAADQRVLCVFRDITEGHLAELRLRESHDLLTRAEAMARIGSWRLNAADGAFWSSEMMLSMNGVPRNEAITVDRLRKMMRPEDFELISTSIMRCLETGESYSHDVVHYLPAGKSFAANIRGQAVYDETGAIIGVAGTVQDISEREAARARISAIADSLPNGAIYRLDYLSPTVGLNSQSIASDVRISYVSAGIERLTGLTVDELMADGSRLIGAIHPDDQERYLQISREATANRSLFECEFRLIKPTGEVVWLQVRSAPRARDDGRIWDGILLDVTQAHAAAKALEEAKEAAEAAERAKADFLATMSHEIRTPMNAVIGMTRLALQTDLSPRQRNYLEKIDNSARTLLGIINDTLDFSRIEAGALQLEQVDFSLDSVLETLNSATSLRAEEKGIEIVYDIDRSVPRALTGDPLRLGQVLINLVGNAVKFTDRGEVRLRIFRSPSDPQHLAFEVSDTGIGMDPDQITHLFRPFTQAEQQTARRYGGTGLGLSICKRLVELMGGKIEATSVIGEGSTFHFTIAQERITGPTLQPVPRTRRALLVDDVPLVLLALQPILEDMGFETLTATSGPEALTMVEAAQAAEQPFDLVVLDWQMPQMDGIETAKRLRAIAGPMAPKAVLMITSHAREEVLHQIDQIGLQGLLVKPITYSMMYNTLQPIFHQHGRNEISTAPTQIAAPPEELFGRRVLVVDDNSFNIEVSVEFLELAGMSVASATSGPEALALLEKESFDVILMDMQMPGMDGLEATRRLQSMPGGRDVPIIALTAQARAEDRESSLRNGMADHLTKPINEATLYRTLARVLKEWGRGKPQVSTPAVDINFALERVRGNKERLGHRIEIFLRDFGPCVDELTEGLKREDWVAIGGVAHRIRGVAGYFNAEHLHHLAETVDQAHYDKSIGLMRLKTPALRDELSRTLAELKAWHQSQQTP